MLGGPFEIQRLLAGEFAKIQAKNPRYSLRSFAKKLGIPVSSLSEILSGKRIASRKAALKILAALGTDANDVSGIVASYSRPSAVRALPFHRLTMDQFHLVSDWYYFAILSLSETEGSRDSPEWIADRLGISPQQARTAMERLVRLDLLTMSNGCLKPTGRQLTTSSDLADLGIRRQHHQVLDLAKESLDRDSVEKRDFTQMTMAIDPARLPEAKRLLRDFRRQFCALMESGEKKAVYKLAIQMFPLTRN